MRRVLLVVAVLALAAFAVWLVATDRAAPVGDSQPGTQQPDTQQPDSEQAGEGADIPIPSDAVAMQVVSVTDGDTLRLNIDGGRYENVRLVGIDTPEVYPVYECFGDEAEAELLRLAPIGSTLRVAADVDPYDDYDRALLYVWNSDGVFINLALVEGGYAEAIRVAPNDLYYDELLAAENRAAHDGLGMWSC